MLGRNLGVCDDEDVEADEDDVEDDYQARKLNSILDGFFLNEASLRSRPSRRCR